MSSITFMPKLPDHIPWREAAAYEVFANGAPLTRPQILEIFDIYERFAGPQQTRTEISLEHSRDNLKEIVGEVAAIVKRDHNKETVIQAVQRVFDASVMGAKDLERLRILNDHVTGFLQEMEAMGMGKRSDNPLPGTYDALKEYNREISDLLEYQ